MLFKKLEMNTFLQRRKIILEAPAGAFVSLDDQSLELSFLLMLAGKPPSNSAKDSGYSYKAGN
ncbi:hypothetical protein J42TS3_13210 [Paenibacillus vini]|uniref:Uncharacterized protein n=2 Tax=Paenibacillus TaxID=44249 RepID=A0ABQ4M8H0_9BACL|nr:hypothetical protein J42TS3_13210 [Paenibacillus vini]